MTSTSEDFLPVVLTSSYLADLAKDRDNFSLNDQQKTCCEGSL